MRTAILTVCPWVLSGIVCIAHGPSLAAIQSPVDSADETLVSLQARPCTSTSAAIVDVGEHATASINRLSGKALENVQTSGVHQFLVAFANTTGLTVHFDPKEHIQAFYDPETVVHPKSSCISGESNIGGEECRREGLAGLHDRRGPRAIPVISSGEAKMVVGERIGGAISIDKLQFANTLLEKVVLMPGSPGDDIEQPAAGNRAPDVVSELGKTDIAPGEWLTGTMAVDVGEQHNGGDIEVKVNLGLGTHEFTYCVADFS